jgi:hypothetical protein
MSIASAGKALAGKAKKLAASTATGPLTRGGLTPGKIVTSDKDENPISPKIEVNFLFNPTDYKLSKTNKWGEKDNDGKKGTKKFGFQETGRVKLSLTLHFDTLMAPESREEPYDVRYHTNDLWKMMEIKKNTPKGKKPAPPLVEFQWGKLVFVAFIESMDQKYTLFREDGVPVRCEVTVNLTQFDPSTSVVIEGIQKPQPATITDASRADLIASLSLGMAALAASSAVSTASTIASTTRKIMENNAIDNPLVLTTGTQVDINAG